MTRVLIVDDRPINRHFLTTLLGYKGFEVREAGGGAEGLQIARDWHPHLAIVDTAMPGMDGGELVRLLRADPDICSTAIIFYTASYQTNEAEAIGRKCGVRHVLMKPCEPELILKTIDLALGSVRPEGKPRASPEPFTDEFVQLQSNAMRTSALVEFQLEVVTQRDRRHAIAILARAARNIIRSERSVVTILDDQRVIGFANSDVGELSFADQSLPYPAQYLDHLRVMIASGRCIRATRDEDPETCSMWGSDVATYLGVPIGTATSQYGWLGLMNRQNGSGAYTVDDERIALTIAAQAAIAYENLLLYEQIRNEAETLEKAVAKRTEELSRTVAQLEKEVAERRRAEEELARKASELQLVNSEMEAFGYSVSHDLRSPLRALQGFSSLLLAHHGRALDEQGKDYLCRIKRAAERMSLLIDDLLHLCRLSRQEIRRTTVDLSAMALAICEELQQQNPNREVGVAIRPGMLVEADESLLRAAMRNLLDNAWKFTSRRADAQIEFDSLRQGDGCTFVVRDNGVGFDMAYADKLFTAFQRLHSEEEFEGHGIGLATVQRVIHRHGGRIWAESEPDRGASFYFTLG